MRGHLSLVIKSYAPLVSFFESPKHEKFEAKILAKYSRVPTKMTERQYVLEIFIFFLNFPDLIKPMNMF